MNLDTWKTVINGPETYAEIWKTVQNGDSILIGWTDGMGTHYDIAFMRGKYSAGRVQSLHPSLVNGMRGHPVLFVSIFRVGAFAFDMGADQALHPNYVAEKLNIPGQSTAQALAVLLNALKSICNGKHYETDIGDIGCREGEHDWEHSFAFDVCTKCGKKSAEA